MQLRDYQRASIDALYQYFRMHKGAPCIVIPTGGGKTPVMSSICGDAVRWGRRVLVIAHVKELLQQTADKLTTMHPDLDYGIYSAGLNSRDTEHSVIIGGIQSIYKRASELGCFDLIMIDEAHMIPPSGDGMYRTFLDHALAMNPKCRVAGLTATPYRLSSGMICAEGNILTDVCYEVGILDLIDGGYLSPLVSKAGIAKARMDTSKLHIRAGEFIESEMAEQMDTEDMVKAACANIKHMTEGRNKVLVFCSGVAHGKHVAEELRKRDNYKDEGVREVYGDTLFRAEQIQEFTEDPLVKYMVNCNVLTTGFDCPHIDCVVLLRATVSPGLYYQMCGRGFRIADGKDDCLVLDYGDNVMRHGPVDNITPIQKTGQKGDGVAPARTCPECATIMAASCTVCPGCGFMFPRQPNHNTEAGEAGILSTETSTDWYDVSSVSYYHNHKIATGSITFRVEYRINFTQTFREWVCFDHSGWARTKACKWWVEAGGQTPEPNSVDEALERVDELQKPTRIRVKSGAGKYDEITKREYDMVNA